MRLKKIKLSGFKSFVDPITIPMSGSLIGVVGPNGCGKSNIIDAVRWVMGESSAKHLRGDSMADVIFSGSNSRKPIGKASVELIFDNSDGDAPGQYAKFSEISIRREGSRDGTSNYFLNKTRCRRKDITSLFLGTGLGPRAYAIIEQGMVTRIIESKPDDLRGFLEEAAGISKYKERRRETENRIRHARENLDRVEDIRKELGSQIKRLERQSKAAAKYKELKEDERRLKAELLALRWQEVSSHIQEHDGGLRGKETELEKVLADQRAIEAEIEDIRQSQTETTEQFNTVQAEYYSVGAAITGLEQSIRHAHETLVQRQREQEQLHQAWKEVSEHLQSDLQQLDQLGKRLEDIRPKIDGAKHMRDDTSVLLQQAEEAMMTWQADWDKFTEASAEPVKQRDVEQSRVQQLTHQIQQLQERQQRLQHERQGIEQSLEGEDVEAIRQQANALDQAVAEQETLFEQTESKLKETRHENDQLHTSIETQRTELLSGKARLESLQEMQRVSQGSDDEALSAWLEQLHLSDAPRLASTIGVTEGWERAVESVLGVLLNGIRVDRLESLATSDLPAANLTFIESHSGSKQASSSRPLLADKIQSSEGLGDLLHGITIADNLTQALSQRSELGPDESIVTTNGEWVGRHWLRISAAGDIQQGIIAREREIEQLIPEVQSLLQAVNTLQQQLQQSQELISELEQQRESHWRSVNERNKDRAQFREQLGQQEARMVQLSQRSKQLADEIQELDETRVHNQGDLDSSQDRVQDAEQKVGGFESERQVLISQRQSLRDSFEKASSSFNQARETLHEIEVERQSIQTAFESTQQSVTRLEGQLKHLIERRQDLEKTQADTDSPEDELKRRLEESLQVRLQVEQRLNEARDKVTTLENKLREKEKSRSEHEQTVEQSRQKLEQARMARQELVVRRQTVEEQVTETGADLDQVISGLPEGASKPDWDEKLAKMDRRINRLGPINLVAIEEFEEQSERKSYLDNQSEDLNQALKTLEDAIHKIDRETKSRFQDTFDRVNEGFARFFPKLFGGGKAYLELTSDNLLETGVTVMARPPGKRNTTIHLLSGGEKSLTAVALLFSLFELNPAPFCFLDEVDAPLDDANVARYSDIIRSMSAKTQLVYVTHNKITMEIADILIGVTMSEPGVSRLVAVDVDEALEMVAQ